MKFRCCGIVINIDQFLIKINALQSLEDDLIEWIIKRLLDDIFPFVQVCDYHRHDQRYEYSYFQLKNAYGSFLETDFSKALSDILPVCFIPSETLLVNYHYGCLVLRKGDGSSWF